MSKKNSQDKNIEFTIRYVAANGSSGQTVVKAKDMATAIGKFEGERPGAKIRSITQKS